MHFVLVNVSFYVQKKVLILILPCFVLECNTFHLKKNSPNIWTLNITNIVWMLKTLCPFLQLYASKFSDIFHMLNHCITKEPKITRSHLCGPNLFLLSLTVTSWTRGFWYLLVIAYVRRHGLWLLRRLLPDV